MCSIRLTIETFETIGTFGTRGLFLFRFPDLVDPFLRFFLARAEFRVGVGERVLDTRFASLVRRYLTEGNIVAQRRTVDVRH